MKLWCVAWFQRDESGIVDPLKREWCACLRQPKGHKRYQDCIATKCSQSVTLPVGIEFREPTCVKCQEKLQHI